MDANHTFGNDLVLAPNGDLSCVDGAVLLKQRLLRRLLTNAGDYLWHTDFGAGLPSLIGKTGVTPQQVQAIIRSQLTYEGAVSQAPPPQIKVEIIPNGMYVEIGYTTLITNQPQSLYFSVTN